MTAIKPQRNNGLKKRCNYARSACPKCSQSWFLNFYHDGRHHRLSLDRHTARDIGSKTERLRH